MAAATDLMIPGPAGKLSVRTKGLESNPAEVVVLVHGANISGQAGFDFSFEGGEDYSLMDALVERGYGAVTFSIRGYAKSEFGDDPLSIQTDQGIEDLATVVDWLETQSVTKPHLLGWSWGGRIVGRFTENNASRIKRLIMMDPAIGGGGVILPPPDEGWWPITYDYFMGRLEDEFTELAAKKALAEQVSREEPQSPNGIRQENAVGSIPVDPEKITVPTQMIYGHAAATAEYMKGTMPRAEFLEKLATNHKELVIVPGGGDYAHIQNPRRQIHKAVDDFLRS